jgi:hypothetical protein
MEDMFNRALPALVRVAVCAPLMLLITWFPKFRTLGDRRTTGTAVNVAVTLWLAIILMIQELLPVQLPLQPTNFDPTPGDAINVTEVPLLKFPVQVEGQLIPTGLLVTVPLPVPARVTLRGKVGLLKVAVTDLLAVMLNEQEPVPVQAPLQPAKVDPAAGDAVRVTIVPLE